MDNNTQRGITGAIVTCAWLAALVAGLLTHDYEGLTHVTPVMLIYAGYVFGAHLITKRLPTKEEG